MKEFRKFSDFFFMSFMIKIYVSSTTLYSYTHLESKLFWKQLKQCEVGIESTLQILIT